MTGQVVPEGLLGRELKELLPTLFRVLATESPGDPRGVELEDQQPAEFTVQDGVKRFPRSIGDNIALFRAQSSNQRKLGCQFVQSGTNQATQRVIEVTPRHCQFSSTVPSTSRCRDSNSYLGQL